MVLRWCSDGALLQDHEHGPRACGGRGTQAAPQALRKPSGHARDLVGGTFRGADAVELDRPVVDVVPRDLVALDEGAHVVNEHREVGRNLEVSELVEVVWEFRVYSSLHTVNRPR